MGTNATLELLRLRKSYRDAWQVKETRRREQEASCPPNAATVVSDAAPTLDPPPAPKTKAEKLLAVARTLPETFSTSELVLAAWKLYPLDFGLGEYGAWPCSNTVIVALSGKRGLCGRGRGLERVGPNLYRVRG